MIDITVNDAVIYDYSTTSESLQPDHTMNMTAITVTGASIERYNIIRNNMNAQPSITLTGFSSTAGTISST